MHVLILNQTFYPDVAATAQHMWELAGHLRAHGHRVSALTSKGIYGTQEQHDSAYECINGVQIHRVGGTAFGKGHLLGRLSDFLSFYAAAYWKLQHLPCPDVILALTSPPMIAAVAMLQKQFRPAGQRRPRMVYHIMDLYPDAALAMGVLREHSLTHRIMSRLTRRTLETSDAVIALGRDMAQLVIDNYGGKRPDGWMNVIGPWADGKSLYPLHHIDNALAIELGLADSFNIVYSGNLGMAHDIDTITAAIGHLKTQAGIQWLFIGGGKRFDQLRQQAGQAGWRNVRFLPYQPREVLNQSLNLADVHLVSQLPEFTGIVVPSKLYGIMAVGKPAIMVGPADAECSRVIAETGMGAVVPNGSSDELIKWVLRLRDQPALVAQMGQRARQAFERNYDQAIACQRIEQVLQSVVNR